MKKVTGISGKRIRVPDSPPRGVEGVAQERMSREGKVNPDLMGPPCFDSDFHQGGITSSLKDLDPAESGFPSGTGGIDRTKFQMRYGPDWRIDDKVIPGRNTRGKCSVYLYQLILTQGGGKNRPSACGACEQNNPGGSPPQAMYGRGSRVLLPHQRQESMFEKPSTGNCWKA